MTHRRALCVGVERFADPRIKALKGPLHDARTTALVLVREYGFAPGEVRVLTDAQATQRAFLDSLGWLLDGARPGDVRVLQVSTQGSHVPDMDGDEADGEDEVLVLYDHAWEHSPLTDDRLAQHLARVPPGVHFATLWDTCHAGSMQDLASTYYRTRSMTKKGSLPDWVEVTGGRYIPPPHGPKAAPTGATKSVPKAAAPRPAPAAATPRRRRPAAPVVPPPAASDVVLPAVSLSACADDETAAEARFGGLRAGAFTWCLHDVLRRHRGDLSWAELHRKTAERMKALGIRQTPQLSAPPGGEALPVFGGRVRRGRVVSTGTAPTPTPTTPVAALDRAIAAHEAAGRWHEALAALWERVGAVQTRGEKVRTLEHIAAVYRVKVGDLAAVRHTATVLLSVDPQHAGARGFLGR